MKIEINTIELTQKEAIELVNKTYKKDNTICKCFHTTKIKHYYTDMEKGIYIGRCIMPPEFIIETETRCSGTKSDEVCDCDGDRKKCTHYSENRED